MFRLSRNWDHPATTYAMTNGIFSNENPSGVKTIPDGWTLGREEFRRSFIRFEGLGNEPEMSKVAQEIVYHRFDMVFKAIEYRQMNCDEAVKYQIAGSAMVGWNTSNRLDLAVLDRLLVAFDSENLPKEKADAFLEAVSPALDGSPPDVVADEDDEPQSGWNLWIDLYRECFQRLKQSLGNSGRMYVQREVLHRGTPISLDSRP